MKEYRKTIIGIILTIFVIGGIGLVMHQKFKSYTVVEAEQAMSSDSTTDVTKLPIEAEVQEIKEVPLYGWATYVGHGMVIMNFSKPRYKEGQTIVFYITGCQTNKEAYLVNANVKH